MMKQRFLLFVILSLVLIGCRDDELVPNTSNDVDDIDFAVLTNYKADEVIIDDVLVTVSDESGNPIESAYVTISGYSLNTSHLGVAHFADVSAFENFMQVSVEKSGYLNNSKTIIPTDLSVAQVINIVLLAEELTTTFDANENQTISLDDEGLSLDFSGGIVDESGDEYSGTVNAYVNYLPADEQSTFEVMPGALLAINNESEMQVLETYGMVSVELRDAAGNELNVTAANPVTITFPIAESQQSYAPETIPLWYFDEELGIWVEDGEATKNSDGTAYVGEVTHFSWWNCDIAMNTVNLCLEVYDQNQEPLSNVWVKVVRNSSGDLFYDQTNPNGSICGPAPANEEFTVEILDPSLSCLADGQLYSGTVGPFSSDATVQLMVDTESQPFVSYIVHGEFLGCAGGVLGDQLMVLESENQTTYQEVADDGTFEFVVLGCEDENFTICLQIATP